MKPILSAFFILVAAPAFACKATLAEFTQLKTGMSPSQAEQIIGCPGILMSSSEVAGYITIMLTWDGSGSIGANMNAMFQNGKLVSKAQFGLR